MKNIIIFGATGAIGAYTTIDLKENGYNIIAVGQRKSDNGFFNDYDIEYQSIDISQRADFEKLPQSGIDVIIHAAGIMPARMKNYFPHKYIDSEIHGTLNILEYMQTAGAKKIIFTTAGSNSSYKMGKIPIPPDVQKTFPPNNDHSIYAICKNAAVDMIEHFHNRFGIQRFVLRLSSNIYSYHPDPYYFVEGQKRWMSFRLIIDKVMRGEDVEIWGDPSKAKENTYIYDCVDVIQKAVESELKGGVYNVGRGVPVTIEEQVKGIVDVFSVPDKKPNIIYRPDKPDIREYVLDISKTRRDLGYTPQWSYLRGLEDMKEKMKNNHFSKLWGTPQDYIDK
jgi:UDP-glucose 4-epimerase